MRSSESNQLRKSTAELRLRFAPIIWVFKDRRVRRTLRILSSVHNLTFAPRVFVHLIAAHLFEDPVKASPAYPQNLRGEHLVPADLIPHVLNVQTSNLCKKY